MHVIILILAAKKDQRVAGDDLTRCAVVGKGTSHFKTQIQWQPAKLLVRHDPIPASSHKSSNMIISNFVSDKSALIPRPPSSSLGSMPRPLSSPSILWHVSSFGAAPTPTEGVTGQERRCTDREKHNPATHYATLCVFT